MIEREIVESAKALGQVINHAAQSLADSKVKCCFSDQEKKFFVKNEKARALTRFEITLMRVKTPQDMLCRISIFVGKNLKTDLPLKAYYLIEETLIGEKIKLEDAMFLLVSFMRLPIDEKSEN